MLPSRDVLLRLSLYAVGLLCVLASGTALGELGTALALMALAVGVLLLLPPPSHAQPPDQQPQQQRWLRTACDAGAAVCVAVGMTGMEQLCVMRGVWSYSCCCSGHPLLQRLTGSAPWLLPLLPHADRCRVPLWLPCAWGMAALAVLDASRVCDRAMQAIAAALATERAPQPGAAAGALAAATPEPELVAAAVAVA